MESYSGVLVIENGKVRMFDVEAEVEAGEGATKIYAREWYVDGLYQGYIVE